MMTMSFLDTGYAYLNIMLEEISHKEENFETVCQNLLEVLLICMLRNIFGGGDILGGERKAVNAQHDILKGRGAQ